jgi:small ligand-binding sensory domain FIST
MPRLTASPQPKSPSPHFIIESVTVTRRQTLFVQGKQVFRASGAGVVGCSVHGRAKRGANAIMASRDLGIRSISQKVLNLLCW